MTTPTIVWATFGDIVHVATINEQSEPHFVMRRCDPTAAPSFYCETHRQHIANLGNLLIHIEPGGEHTVAVWCRRHRICEAVRDEDLALIRGAVAS